MRRRLLPLCLLVIAAPPVECADPFYEARLAEGVAAAARADHESAVQQLRVANFGFLEDPERLVEGLIHLGLSQAALRDAGGFRSTFDRITGLESRFAAWATAKLDPRLRAEYERAVAEWIPESELIRSPGFAALAERRRREALAQLPPKARRLELRSLIEADPRNEAWPLELARLEIAANDRREALAQLDRVLELDPGHVEARCLRGPIRTELGACEDAGPDLELCPNLPVEGKRGIEILECLVALPRWELAREHLARLPDGSRRHGRVRRLERRIEQFAPLGPSAAGAAEVGAGAPGTEALRNELRNATEAARIDALADHTRALADGRPEDRELQWLAAEAAYRAGRLREAADRLGREGPPPDDRPEIRNLYRLLGL